MKVIISAIGILDAFVLTRSTRFLLRIATVAFEIRFLFSGVIVFSHDAFHMNREQTTLNVVAMLFA